MKHHKFNLTKSEKIYKKYRTCRTTVGREVKDEEKLQP